MKNAVVILAGGEGRRIGGGKPLRHVLGRTLLDHVLTRAQGWRIPIALSVHEPDQLGDMGNYPILVDGGGEGPISGLASALRFARQQALDTVLTIPCDTPLLPQDLLDRLSVALSAGAATAVSDGRLHPSCTLWNAQTADALPDYISAGRSSLKGFAAQVGVTEVEWATEPFDPFFNVNDEADLAAVEALLKSR
jgi:molybdopterin-guanine dinucleotide biosynthesis protein A